MDSNSEDCSGTHLTTTLRELPTNKQFIIQFIINTQIIKLKLDYDFSNK